MSAQSERQDGWYWVKGEHTSWFAALWVNPPEGSTQGWMVARPEFIHTTGPRIPSPDEAPTLAPALERPELEKLLKVWDSGVATVDWFRMSFESVIRYALAAEAQLAEVQAAPAPCSPQELREIADYLDEQRLAHSATRLREHSVWLKKHEPQAARPRLTREQVASAVRSGISKGLKDSVRQARSVTDEIMKLLEGE